MKLLKYTLTSQEPLTNTILKSSSKNKEIPPNQFASAIRERPCTRDIKMDVKLIRSKSQKKIVFAEASENFVDFMFSFLTIPLGSIVKLLDGNTFVGCVDNLYKSVESLDSSWCTDSRSMLLNPGLAPQFGCPNQPLNISDVETPTTYYYGTGSKKHDPYYGMRQIQFVGGVISKSYGSVYEAKTLTSLDPRSPNRSNNNVVGFVKRPTLYGVADDLTVKVLSGSSCLSYLKELSLPLDDLEMKVISIGEAEVKWLLFLNVSVFSWLECIFNFLILSDSRF